MENQSIEEINNFLYNSYIKKGKSPKKYITELVYKLYFKNKLCTIKHLVEVYGTDILTHQNVDGDTILHHSSQISLKIFINIFKLLPSLLQIKNNKGNTPLHYLVNVLTPDIVEKESIPIHNIQNNELITPLMLSVINNNNDLTRYIINNYNVYAHTTDNTGNNILHICYKIDNKEMIIFIEDKIPDLISKKNNINLIPKEYYTYIYNKDNLSLFNNENYQCCICQQLLFDPCVLPCSHKYCYECIYNVSPENVVCKYRCNIPQLNKNSLKIDTEMDEKIKKELDVNDIIKRKNIFYIHKFYAIIRYLSLQSDTNLVVSNDVLHMQRGGLEIILWHKNHMLFIKTRILQYLPQDSTSRKKILHGILEFNKPIGNIGAGSIFIDKSNMSIYSVITLHIDYFNITCIPQLIHAFISGVHVMSASLATVRDTPVNILENITYSMKKYSTSSILHTISLLYSPSKVNADTIKIKNNIHVKIGKETSHIELEKYIAHIDTNHTKSLEYISGYHPDNIDNFRITVDSLTGIVLAYSLIILGTCRESNIKKSIDNFDSVCTELTDLIPIHTNAH